MITMGDDPGRLDIRQLPNIRLDLWATACQAVDD